MKFFTSKYIIANELRLFLFFLPFQTAFIASTVFIGGSIWQQATIIFYLTEILLVLMGIRHWFNKKINCSGLIIVMLIYFFVMIWHASDSWLAFQTIRRIIEAGILCMLIREKYLNNQQIIFWLAVGSIVPAVLGIAQFFGQTTWGSTLLGTTTHSSWIAGASVVVTSAGRWLRAYGTFPHPNILGGFMVIVISHILFFLQSEEKFRQIKTKKLKWFFIVILIILTVGLVVSFSRSAWLAWAFMIIFSHWRIFRQPLCRDSFFSLGVFVSAFSFLVLLGLLWPIVTTRFSMVEIHEVNSISERVIGYAEAWNIFKNNWFFGAGPGNFTVFLQKQNSALNGWQLQPVHNVFVLGLVEWGIFGMIFWLWFIYFIAKNMRFKLENVIWGLGPIFVLSFFDHYLYTTWIGLCLFAISISSTCYPHQRSVEAKNSLIYPH
ncbi:MAG: hypothetical protein A2821_04445 [Candidatus Magasanikbacteria bacterium RIFCSPHIGHO2_01_FULL_41_23]|uniref:O-antigen ligase-related domain-containing protein n=1 Tax=Candidatus Magasanikbacteria bacterium RIFCSPLOWO2_01_FULL_40_15 TaxID=1798686 RepID=A0A1F6N4B0_9BACT|nr:MAG: hypothetical protein A2821_04445 [Candidatus Magasanikbacteria bacterium RIFCSPHIGHO2_01_FULL_41_23]OGH67175.1 MAG: hypothetical protein A3C66_02760 [Candidatus Magasanikbacteria bacterium RIFCSPHIGHO2_02_FULL_41_35]OGH75460.1 MAG: hypothetical protein A3F22_01385 [Candidatus Magasanikbacteria bacterium RIFCSPHIGHO2_12_FULL_41_16]OGH78712.1 MAG: hypothetical protein A2983_04400 [Candidatus Magasanikbacteria bacterium RIFCSPLOWO2_01_FULL_40_15]